MNRDIEPNRPLNPIRSTDRLHIRNHRALWPTDYHDGSFTCESKPVFATYDLDLGGFQGADGAEYDFDEGEWHTLGGAGERLTRNIIDNRNYTAETQDRMRRMYGVSDVPPAELGDALRGKYLTAHPEGEPIPGWQEALAFVGLLGATLFLVTLLAVWALNSWGS